MQCFGVLFLATALIVGLYHIGNYKLCAYKIVKNFPKDPVKQLTLLNAKILCSLR